MQPTKQSQGGKARALKLSPKRREAIAKLGYAAMILNARKGANKRANKARNK